MLKKNKIGLPGRLNGNGTTKISSNDSQKIKLTLPLEKISLPLNPGVSNKTAITLEKIKKIQRFDLV